MPALFLFKSEVHSVIEQLVEGADESGHNIIFTSYPHFTFLFQHPLFTRLVHILRAVSLPFILWRHRNAELIVVREFLTVPFLITAICVWPIRKKIMLVVNHNIQLAHSRKLDRVALKVLFRSKFKFLCLESDAGIRELNIIPKKNQILVLPLAINSEFSGDNHSDLTIKDSTITIGLIGKFRPEKGGNSLLNCLALEIAKRKDIKLLVGSPDQGFLKEGENMGFSTIDTTTSDQYRIALKKCDIVILNYQKERYFYRSSGVILDAAQNKCAVICPNFPVLKDQITIPEAIGLTFNNLDELSTQISELLILLHTIDFTKYNRYRNTKNISEKFKKFLDRSKT